MQAAMCHLSPARAWAILPSCNQLGFSEKYNISTLTNFQIQQLSQIVIPNFLIGRDKRRDLRNNENRLIAIGCYRGLYPHSAGYEAAYTDNKTKYNAQPAVQQVRPYLSAVDILQICQALAHGPLAFCGRRLFTSSTWPPHTMGPAVHKYQPTLHAISGPKWHRLQDHLPSIMLWGSAKHDPQHCKEAV